MLVKTEKYHIGKNKRGKMEGIKDLNRKGGIIKRRARNKHVQGKQNQKGTREAVRNSEDKLKNLRYKNIRIRITERLKKQNKYD